MPAEADEIRRALLRVPRFREASTLRWQLLSGGLSHATVRVQADNDLFAVRLPSERGADSATLAWHDELRVLVAVSARGLAPQPAWCDEQSGVLVTHFHHGPVWTADEIRERNNWPRLTRLLRRVHAVELAVPDFEPVAAAGRYWAQYESTGQVSIRAAASWRRFQAESGDLGSALDRVCLCHNDVIHSNLVGESPLLVDWEFAACSDPLFDLATVIVYHDLSAAQGASLLEQYRGGHDAVAAERLQVLCRLCRYVSWFWNLARLGREPGDGDWTVALPA